MAIYSLRMSSVGKTTQKQPFTAAAHIKYITRKEAVTHVMAARMPEVRRQAIAWLKREERFDRKNARVIDKVVLALPRELSTKQWHALVKAFAEELTQGRASWLAAFHTTGKDRDNPHCHLVLRDRDVETGKRVMLLSAGQKEKAERSKARKSRPTTAVDVRKLWERFANGALAAAGRAERIDHRSLKEQGVGRAPQVHEGPNIRAMHARGFRPTSRNRIDRRRAYGRRAGPRVVRWAEIDKGRTRVEYNAALRAAAQQASEMHLGQERGGRSGLSGNRPRPGPHVTTALQTPTPILPVRSDPSPAGPPQTPPERPMTTTQRYARDMGAPKAQPNPKRDRDRGR